MKHLPLIIAIIALVVAIFGLMRANTALERIEGFGLRPHAAAESTTPGNR